MAATKNLVNYEAPGTVACTLTSLASGSARESAIVDNSANKFLDDLVALTFTIASGAPSTTGPYVNIYAAGSEDGTLWPVIQLASGAPQATGGGDAALGALGVPTNLRLIGSFGLQTTTSTVERTFRTEPFSVAQAFGGVLPPKYSIIVENQVGVALTTATATTAQYVQHQPITTTAGN